MKTTAKADICACLAAGPQTTLQIAAATSRDKKTVSEMLFLLLDFGVVEVTGKKAQTARGRPVNIWRLV